MRRHPEELSAVRAGQDHRAGTLSRSGAIEIDIPQVGRHAISVACRPLFPIGTPTRLRPRIAGRDLLADEQDVFVDVSHIFRPRGRVVPAGPAEGAGQHQIPPIHRHPETTPAMRARQDRDAAIHRDVPGRSPLPGLAMDID
jgi:hypothetical protein